MEFKRPEEGAAFSDERKRGEIEEGDVGGVAVGGHVFHGFFTSYSFALLLSAEGRSVSFPMMCVVTQRERHSRDRARRAGAGRLSSRKSSSRVRRDGCAPQPPPLKEEHAALLQVGREQVEPAYDLFDVLVIAAWFDLVVEIAQDGMLGGENGFEVLDELFFTVCA